MKGLIKPLIQYTSTVGVVWFSLANLNLILTSLILVLTAAYWIQKNKGIYRQNKKDQEK